MIEFLLLPANQAFTVALVVMLLIGIAEALGFGFAPDTAEMGADGPAAALSWLGFDRLPLLILLVVALGTFALVGLALQQAALAWWGGVLPARTACGRGPLRGRGRRPARGQRGRQPPLQRTDLAPDEAGPAQGPARGDP